MWGYHVSLTKFTWKCEEILISKKKSKDFKYFTQLLLAYGTTKRPIDYLLGLHKIKKEGMESYESYHHRVKHNVMKALDRKITVEMLTNAIFIEGLSNNELKRHFRLEEGKYNANDLISYF